MADNKPGPNDIVIAVMGVTGVGKSSFVQIFTRENVPISSKLNSCTQKIGVYKCSMPGIPKFFLVDTPGFDDTNRSDSDVLRELAKYLAKAYEYDILLNGLIYLHRIMDNRFTGASGRNLRTFKKLTGDENLSSVVLGTTFWKQPISSDDVARETQLNTDASLGWSRMLEQGAKCMRHDQWKISGQAIVRYLIERKSQVVLKIQKQIVDERMAVAETDAGAEVISEMRRIHEAEMAKLKHDLLEAMNERDRNWQRQIEAERAERERYFARQESASFGLRERLRDWWDDVDCTVM